MWEKKTEFTIPTMSEDEIAAAAELVEASSIQTADPRGWVGEQTEKVQNRARILHENDLDFDDAGILINISDRHLSIDALMEVMRGKGLLSDFPNNTPDYIKKYATRQNISSGGVLVANKEANMFGMPQSDMEMHITRASAKIIAISGDLALIQLGVMPTLQLYHQSAAVRDGAIGTKVYTPDRVTYSTIANVGRCGNNNQTYLNNSSGDESYYCGTRAAVVERRAIRHYEGSPPWLD
ncbi:hypothetical protein FWF74_02230 [Candidatus Saccharibacteria bacterium]|nr:hypothetical protein [Candidatus Saccharibacteria bacterium]